jgi:hypothetical protein
MKEDIDESNNQINSTCNFEASKSNHETAKITKSILKK